MAVTNYKYYGTTSDKLGSIAEETGNIIFVTDERYICIDTPNGREEFRQLTTLNSDEVRRLTPGKNGMFYFVLDTKVLWTYNDGWIQISTEPQIIFDAIEDFPIVGDSNKLYVAQNEIYRYYSGSYHLCNNDSVWEII